jgi:Protein of unknown function DUF262
MNRLNFDTAAGNRRVSELIERLESKSLIPRPDFQRRLVWTTADKNEFLRTVLQGYPFPEIYIAANKFDIETAKSTEQLVDGQQRVTTLHQYFIGSDTLKLDKDIPAFKSLQKDEQTQFLNYQVAVRSLGIVDDTIIKEVFKRINRTSYSLNRMERRNAEYQGALKRLGERIAESRIFDRYNVFSDREVRRMTDVVFSLSIVITMMSSYFHRESEVESYLITFNDEFPQEQDIVIRLAHVFRFLRRMRLLPSSRAWKKADLFVLICELDRLLNLEKVVLEVNDVATRLTAFYQRVGEALKQASSDELLQRYFKTTLQATADRTNRVARAEAIRKVILGEWVPN